MAKRSALFGLLATMAMACTPAQTQQSAAAPLPEAARPTTLTSVDLPPSNLKLDYRDPWGAPPRAIDTDDPWAPEAPKAEPQQEQPQQPEPAAVDERGNPKRL
jgi:hypothetical protein